MPEVVLNQLQRNQLNLQAPCPLTIEPPLTPHNRHQISHKVRRAQLYLNRRTSLQEIASTVDHLHHLLITREAELKLERDTFKKWKQEHEKDAKGKRDMRRIRGQGYGEVMDWKTIVRLKKQREERDTRQATRKRSAPTWARAPTRTPVRANANTQPGRASQKPRRAVRILSPSRRNLSLRMTLLFTIAALPSATLPPPESL